MENAIARDFRFLSFLKFTIPTICMMVLFSLYTIVDGIFVARYVGERALAATNIVYPMLNVVLGVAIMFATGGCAFVAKTMGEGKLEAARKRFTFIVIAAALLGSFIAAVFVIFLEPIIYFLGATAALYAYSSDYAAIMSIFAPVIILKIVFDYFFVAAGRPKLGLYNAILGGVSNILLDYLFIAVWGWGIQGAAWATVIGYSLPCAVGLVYFAFSKHALHFVRPEIEWKTLTVTCGNGYSEMVTELSLAVTTFLFNFMMLKYLGEDGVAAITIILYAEFLLTAVYLGFSSGAAPIVSYNFGARDRERLKRLMRYGYCSIMASSVVSFLLAQIFAVPLVSLFVDPGTAVYEITLFGFRLFAVSFLLSGFNIFSSGMFTAFSNGRTSAILSFCRNFAFILLFMAVLPAAFGANGIWLVVAAADVAALLVNIGFLRSYRVLKGYI